MINLFKQELQEIYSFFKNNYKEAVILCMSTLFLVLAIYRPIGSSLVVSYTVYYIILPVFTILIILRKNPLNFGLRFGDYKLWWFYVAITVLIAIPVLYIGSLFSSLKWFRFFLPGNICFAVFSSSDLRKDLKKGAYSYRWFPLCFFISENPK